MSDERKFSRISEQRLQECHPDLQRVIRRALADGPLDFSVLCGHRGEAEQEKAVHDGKSKQHYPSSKHNSLPSKAVDVAPCPIDWNDRKRFVDLYRQIFAAAAKEGVKIRWGGDFNRDGNLSNDSFVDMPHYELDF